MQDIWRLVKNLADAVTAKITDHAEAIGFRMNLDSVADIAKSGARLDIIYGPHQAFIGHFDQALGLDLGLADIKHARRIAMPAVNDGGRSRDSHAC